MRRLSRRVGGTIISRSLMTTNGSLPAWQVGGGLTQRMWYSLGSAQRCAAVEAARCIVVESLLDCPMATTATSAPAASMLVVVDRSPCSVGTEVAEGYMALGSGSSGALQATKLEFDPGTFMADVDSWIAGLGEGVSPVVVLVQKGAFQNELRQYRLRLELFKKKCRVAEHCHLGLLCGGKDSESQTAAYLEACSYSPHEALSVGTSLAAKLDGCTVNASIPHTGEKAAVVAYDLVIESKGGHELVYSGGLEPCVLNTGHYEATRAVGGSSVGGTYPVGEVITEACDLGTINGTASFFGYPTLSKSVGIVPEGQEFTLTVENGCITSSSYMDDNTTKAPRGGYIPNEMKELMAVIRQAETVPTASSRTAGKCVTGDIHNKPIAIRELGIGLNPYLGRHRTLGDVTSFERQRGVHLSIGMRHPLFPKKPRVDLMADGSGAVVPQVGPVLRRKDGSFHIDIFIAAERILRRPKAEVVEAVNKGILMVSIPLGEEVVWSAHAM